MADDVCAGEGVGEVGMQGVVTMLDPRSSLLNTVY